MIRPVRLKRSRSKDSKLVSPNGLPNTYVGRPSKYANLIRVSVVGRDTAYTMFQQNIDTHQWFDYPSREEIRRDLSGKNLVCWCNEFEKCHADILLEIAND